MVLQQPMNSEQEFVNENEIDALWTVTDVARYLRIQPTTVRALTRRGKLPAVKIGKVWRFDPRKIRAGDFPLNTEEP